MTTGFESVIFNPSSTNADVLARDPQYVFHSWSIQNQFNPLVIARAEGSRLWDYDGKEYLDFSSQLVNTNIGHNHPAVVAAIREQTNWLTTVAPHYANIARGEAAKLILKHAPQGFAKVFFTNGGADAIENAIRMARAYTGRSKILSAYRSYHGNTMAAINTTGERRRLSNEFAFGHVHFFAPYLYRSEFYAENDTQECERALRHLRRIVELEGGNQIAAIVLESIPGTSGIIPPPQGYIEGVRQICDEHGILLILDEVMVGFGRTGRWLALERYDAVPDLITFAKGVNSGYVPTGGVILSQQISSYFDDKMFVGGLTYSGHPLAMASIVACITAMEQEKVVEHAASLGHGVLGSGVQELFNKHELIGDVRGEGVFWALELVKDRTTREPVPNSDVVKLKAQIASEGLLIFGAENRLHLAPPCNISEADVKTGLTIIDKVLTQYQG